MELTTGARPGPGDERRGRRRAPAARRSSWAPGGGRLGASLTTLVALALLGCLCLGAGRLGVSDLHALGGLGGLGVAEADGASGGRAPGCPTGGPQRLADPTCRSLTSVNSIQGYWRAALPQVFGVSYQTVPARFFTTELITGCGVVVPGGGPLACPVDQVIYVDQRTADRVAAVGGRFGLPYLLAHEYGHHVQDLLGARAAARRAQLRDPARADAYAAAVEQQADCYAGVWAFHAAETLDPGDAQLVADLTVDELHQAVSVVAVDPAARGDGQRVETGLRADAAVEREQWLRTGYETGDPQQCDPFTPAGLNLS